MQFASIVAAAGIGLGCCNAAVGQGEQVNWVEAQSLRELPPGIQVLLGVGLAAGEGGIADRGDRFNATDVRMDDVPQRRFVLGIVNGDTAVVAVERGGRGYAVQTLEFKQVGPTWQTARCATSLKVPRHGEEMLDSIAHPVQGLPACSLSEVMPLAIRPTASR